MLTLLIPIHYVFSAPYPTHTPCPTVPNLANRSLIISYINETQRGNFCAINALNFYGQRILTQYNITTNLTALNANFSNKYVKQLPLISGTLSAYEQLLGHLLIPILISILIAIILLAIIVFLLIRNGTASESSVKTAALGVVSGAGISIFYIFNEVVSRLTYVIIIAMIIAPIILFLYLKLSGNKENSKKLRFTTFVIFLILGIIIGIILLNIPVLWLNIAGPIYA